MSLTVYEIPLDWVPDRTYINATPDADYIAWRIGINTKAKIGLWFIEAITGSPASLDSVLPVANTSFILLDEVSKYGYTRTAQPEKTIAELESDFLATVAGYS